MKQVPSQHICAAQEVVAAEVEKRREQIHCVLCLGHNKGMEEAASSLAVRPLPDSLTLIPDSSVCHGPPKQVACLLLPYKCLSCHKSICSLKAGCQWFYARDLMGAGRLGAARDSQCCAAAEER